MAAPGLSRWMRAFTLAKPLPGLQETKPLPFGRSCECHTMLDVYANRVHSAVPRRKLTVGNGFSLITAAHLKDTLLMRNLIKGNQRYPVRCTVKQWLHCAIAERVVPHH